MPQDLPYLAHYPAHLQHEIRQLIDSNKLGNWLRGRYPQLHKIAKDNDLDFLFDKSSDMIMLFSNPEYDMSDEVLKELGVVLEENQFDD